MSIKYNTKAIVTVPAWAQAMHEGTEGLGGKVKDAVSAYTYVPLVYRATRLISNALVGVPVRFYEGDKEVEWAELFPDVSLRRLLWYTQAAMSLSGAAFIEKVPRRLSKKVGNLQWVNPVSMNTPKLIKTEDGGVDYEFSQKNKFDVKWNLDTMFYMREFSLNDDVGPGDSSGKVALNDARLLRYASQYVASFFEKGAMPVTILSFDGIIDPDEARRVETWFQRAASNGLRTFGRVLGLNRGVEPKILSQALKDLVVPELVQSARDAVADAFDMNPSMFDRAPNMATAQEYRLSLYEESVRPRAEMLQEEFNRQILAPLDIEMRFAFEELSIFQEDENKRSTSVKTLTEAISTDPEVAEFVMNTVLGYDLDEEQQQKFDELISKKKTEKQPPAPPAQQQTTPAEEPTAPAAVTETPPAKAAWADDLGRWERKALRVLKESGSPVCAFDSETIPEALRSEIAAALPECQSADAVRSLFGTKSAASATTPAPEYKADPGTYELAASINALAEAYLKSLTALPVPQPNINVTLPPAPAAVDTQPIVVINNPRPSKSRRTPTPQQVFARTAFKKE